MIIDDGIEKLLWLRIGVDRCQPSLVAGLEEMD